jgi:membrane fusion protein, heavy metal efflux system
MPAAFGTPNVWVPSWMMNVIPHPNRTGPDRPMSDGAAAEWPSFGGQQEIPLSDQGHLSPAVAEVRAARRRRLLPWLVAGAVVLLAVVGAYLWLLNGQRAPSAAELHPPQSSPAAEFRLSDAEMRALRIDEVHVQEFRAERMADGRIAYNEDRSTPVFSPHNGRVVRVLARLGEEIEVGKALLELETTDLAGAANDLLAAADAGNKARATLEQAQREERRQNSLLAARAASQRDVEQARVAAVNAADDLRSAEATVAAARGKLRVLGRTQEQIRRIEATRQVDAVVPVGSPIAGTVVQRRVGPGQWLSSGGSDPTFTIADLSTMWLVAAVRERDAPLVRLDQPVEVTVGALPDQRFDARVTSIGAGLDPTTRRLTVRAEVNDPEHLLKPEMFATFHITFGEPTRSISVPANAVVHRGSEASVWVVLDGNRFVRRGIATGMLVGDMLQVTDGLNEGERVVTHGALFIDRAARKD